MTIVDTHCHLYLEEFDADRASLVKAARDKGVDHICLPAIDSETHQRVIDTELQYPGVCHAMMGLHPCYVKENFREELSMVAGWLSNRPFIAIGEAGLDFYWDKTSLLNLNLNYEKLHLLNIQILCQSLFNYAKFCKF